MEVYLPELDVGYPLHAVSIPLVDGKEVLDSCGSALGSEGVDHSNEVAVHVPDSGHAQVVHWQLAVLGLFADHVGSVLAFARFYHFSN